jgi:excinuclease ABC subunit C
MMSKREFDKTSFLKNQTLSPGIYQMLSDEGVVLYVGKAKQLKKRLQNYFQKNLAPKTAALMRQVTDIQVIVTRTETEALVLENNLIKKHHPRYNILFRDDKSYPYIFVNNHHDAPCFKIYRGAKKQKGLYLGPYPSTMAARASVDLVNKIFKLRTCRDGFYQNRSRPCLQYQIKRCSAPCVKKIDQTSYQGDFKAAFDFLSGSDETVLKRLQKTMDDASKALQFEQAALIRDQIAALREVQASQYAEIGLRHVDVLVVMQQGNLTCIDLLMIRQGRILGNKSFIETSQMDQDAASVLSHFIAQHYLDKKADWPDMIALKTSLSDQSILAKAVSDTRGKKVKLQTGGKQAVKQWLKMAEHNAVLALQTRLLSRSQLDQQFVALKNLLATDEMPSRIECFDISHSHGEATVASCVVFDQQGPKKSDYRRFNIKAVTAGDDYAAMAEAVERRFKALIKQEAALPDLLLIDGGKGQLSSVEKALADYDISGVLILAIAKGPTRKAGFEHIWQSGKKLPLRFTPDNHALLLLQHIRDEAHRFAITANRTRVSKARQHSVLEDIDGIGDKKRSALLKHFGGIQALKKATLEELIKVPGISQALAKKILDQIAAL